MPPLVTGRNATLPDRHWEPSGAHRSGPVRALCSGCTTYAPGVAVISAPVGRAQPGRRRWSRRGAAGHWGAPGRICAQTAADGVGRGQRPQRLDHPGSWRRATPPTSGRCGLVSGLRLHQVTRVLGEPSPAPGCPRAATPCAATGGATLLSTRRWLPPRRPGRSRRSLLHVRAHPSAAEVKLGESVDVEQLEDAGDVRRGVDLDCSAVAVGGGVADEGADPGGGEERHALQVDTHGGRWGCR